MATCDELQTKNQDLVRRANNIVESVSTIRGSAPGAPLEQLQAFYRTTQSLRNTLDDVTAELLVLNNQAADAGCKDVAEKTSRSLNLLQFGLSQDLFQLDNSLLKTINDKKKEAQETRQATTSPDNAGDGSPGSAPSSSEEGRPAPSEEVPVTGKTAPEPVPVTETADPTATPSAVGATAPKTVGAPPPPATKPVPSPQGKPGTGEYVSGLIKAEVVKAQNALATACPDKAKAQADVKKILANLGGSIAAAVATATDADGKPLSTTAKNALSAELQGAISTVGKTSKEIDAKNCDAEPAAGTTDEETPESENTEKGLQGSIKDARAQATLQDTTNFEQMQDWRVRLCLSPGADYLYKAPEGQRGILDPLAASNGVVFPYTPAITVGYSARYDETNPTHSNYKILQYTNSSVDQVTISCDFTAQDTREANYLLAVIHFFRSVTKMWYGQDQFPKPGTPPPLVYLFGLGQFQFNAHPLVVTNFTYTLPNEVDYIRAGAITQNPGVNREPSKPGATQTTGSSSSALKRIESIVVQVGKNFLNSILPGGEPGPAQFTPSGFNAQVPGGTIEPTYVPTKMNIQVICTPVVSRNDISNRFSLKDYASGKLLLGTQNKGGGIW